MSFPGSYPVPAEKPPGLFPLRPMTVGEILTSSIRIAWSHIALLAPIALVFGALTTGVNLAIVAGFGDLRTYATGDWAVMPAVQTNAWLESTLKIAGHLLLGTWSEVTLSLVVTPFLVGLAAAAAAQSATSRVRDFPGLLRRLQGRWLSLLAAGALAGLLTGIGLGVLVVPGCCCGSPCCPPVRSPLWKALAR